MLLYIVLTAILLGSIVISAASVGLNSIKEGNKRKVDKMQRLFWWNDAGASLLFLAVGFAVADILVENFRSGGPMDLLLGMAAVGIFLGLPYFFVWRGSRFC